MDNLLTTNHKPVKVTLYITNHNYSKYLKQSIESAISQSYDKLEILIIDDGSTDNSRQIIEEYRGEDNIKIFYNKNQGLTKSANFAIKQSTGDYIIRLDADDILAENAIEILISKMDNEIAAVFPAYYLIDSDGKIYDKIKRSDKDFFLFPSDQEPHGACMLINKKILKELGNYSETNSCRDGYDFWNKVKDKYKVKSIPDYLFYYRQHDSNLTKDLESIAEAERIIEGV